MEIAYTFAEEAIPSNNTTYFTRVKTRFQFFDSNQGDGHSLWLYLV